MTSDPSNDRTNGAATDSTERARALVEHVGTTFADTAGIELRDEPGPLWQLFVLTQLLSTRISSDVAVATARELFAAGWVTPQALAASTWRQRVDALGRGGYRRYDFSTATRLEANARQLMTQFGGDLRQLRDEAIEGTADSAEASAAVARSLRTLDGIGPTGAGIFLREVQAVWPGVRPCVDALVLKGARAAGLPESPGDLARLVAETDLARLCAALVRVARRPALLDEIHPSG